MFLKRHEIEQVVADENKKLEVIKKGIEMNKKKFNVLKNQLEVSRTELEIYQVSIISHICLLKFLAFITFKRKKQRQLNQVLCTVVLNLNQICGFDPEKMDISNLLLFSKTKLSALYKRVTVLQQETLEQKGKLE